MMINKKIGSGGCFKSLAYSIGSISIACGSLMQLQSTSERISVQRGLCLTSLGFVYFISLTEFFNKYLIETAQGISFRKKYHLMISDVMDITNKIVSAIQASFSCLAGFVVCKSSCSKSFLFASHFVLEAYAWFGTAYFMYDIWSMYKVHLAKIADKLKIVNLSTTRINSSSNKKTFPSDTNNVTTSPTIIPNGFLYDSQQNSNKSNSICKDKQNGGEFYEEDYRVCSAFNGTNSALTLDFFKYMLNHPVMMIHHIFIGTFGFLVIVYIRGGGDCVYSFMYMMEFSTPFVSLRGILSILGLKNNKIYLLNGIGMLVTFFICRILMWPYVFYWYSIVINKSIILSIIDLKTGCKIGILILFLPQIYWFYLMLKGAMKVFFPQKTPPKKTTTSKNNNLSPTTSTPINLIYDKISSSSSSHNYTIFNNQTLTTDTNQTTPKPPNNKQNLIQNTIVW